MDASPTVEPSVAVEPGVNRGSFELCSLVGTAFTTVDNGLETEGEVESVSDGVDGGGCVEVEIATDGVEMDGVENEGDEDDTDVGAGPLVGSWSSASGFFFFLSSTHSSTAVA